MEKQKKEIESESGMQFKWMKLPELKRSKIKVERHDFELEDTNTWTSHQQWLLETTEKIELTFAKRIQQWKKAMA